jgi:hypothetical protein
LHNLFDKGVFPGVIGGKDSRELLREPKLQLGLGCDHI